MNGIDTWKRFWELPYYFSFCLRPWWQGWLTWRCFSGAIKFPFCLSLWWHGSLSWRPFHAMPSRFPFFSVLDDRGLLSALIYLISRHCHIGFPFCLSHDDKSCLPGETFKCCQIDSPFCLSPWWQGLLTWWCCSCATHKKFPLSASILDDRGDAFWAPPNRFSFCPSSWWQVLLTWWPFLGATKQIPFLHQSLMMGSLSWQCFSGTSTKQIPFSVSVLMTILLTWQCFLAPPQQIPLSASVLVDWGHFTGDTFQMFPNRFPFMPQSLMTRLVYLAIMLSRCCQTYSPLNLSPWWGWSLI